MHSGASQQRLPCAAGSCLLTNPRALASALSLRHFREHLLIEVYDTDDTPPALSRPGDDAESGRWHCPPDGRMLALGARVSARAAVRQRRRHKRGQQGNLHVDRPGRARICQRQPKTDQQTAALWSVFSCRRQDTGPVFPPGRATARPFFPGGTAPHANRPTAGTVAVNLARYASRAMFASLRETTQVPRSRLRDALQISDGASAAPGLVTEGQPLGARQICR
jgi:hypothetical protein